MSCGCEKVERSPLWTAVPEFRQPTEIQAGENIECYAQRSGSPSGLKNDIGGQLEDRIKNTSMTSDLEGNVNVTFVLTPNSVTTPTSWEYEVDGVAPVNPWHGLDFGGNGEVTGTIEEAYANKAYQVKVIAKNGVADIDTRVFTFFPKKGVNKDGTIKFVNPLVAMTGTAKSRITCAFGPRVPPAPGASSMHNGCDFAMEDHSIGYIVAAADGVVVKAGPATGFGNWVVIEHYDAQKRLVATTVYGHMNDGHIYVSVGDKVAAGQKIAMEGNAGIGSGAHLHFEMHKGKWRTPTDPTPYLNGELDIAADNDPNTESEDGTPEPIGFETQNLSNTGMTTAEAEASNQCPDALPEDAALESHDEEEVTEDPPTPPVSNVNKFRSDCAPTSTPSTGDVLAAIQDACDDFNATAPGPLQLSAYDMQFIRIVAQIESNLDPYAKNPTSSATGLYQFLDALANKYYTDSDTPDVSGPFTGVAPGLGLERITCANRCDPYLATKAMILFFVREMRPYWTNYDNGGKITIAGKTIKDTDWSSQYKGGSSTLSKGDFLYGLIHHDGVGNAVNGKDLGGVNYWRKKNGVSV